LLALRLEYRAGLRVDGPLDLGIERSGGSRGPPRALPRASL